MAVHLKIAAVAFNPHVGALAANRAGILDRYHRAADAGADLVVIGECALTGYPLEDLVCNPGFMADVEHEFDGLVADVAASGRHAGLLVGAPRRALGGGVHNSAFLVDPGRGDVQVTDKRELPNYGVFDEKRNFVAGTTRSFEFRGHRIGVPLCEDLWFPSVCQELKAAGAELLIGINGSPFEAGKNVTRRRVVAKRIKETSLPFVYVNLVGGQDELVFDGGAFAYDGARCVEAPPFEARTDLFDVRLGDPVELAAYGRIEPSGDLETYQALVAGVRDFCRKQRFETAVIGFSGGVDSALTAAIACDALGPANVTLVRLPSRFSSRGSLTDAADAAGNLGAVLYTMAIEPIAESVRTAIAAATADNPAAIAAGPFAVTGLTDENIQPRIRMTLLMAVSNARKPILLTTGNKSETSVGYTTIYGDMAGGFNVLKDVYKTTVFRLGRLRNGLDAATLTALGLLGRAGEVVPEAILAKPPSAELRPDQKDADSLPPYDRLDAILAGSIEAEKTVAELVAEGHDEAEVRRVRNLVVLAEFKRRQGAPGPKVTARQFNRDRRYPIVSAWRS